VDNPEYFLDSDLSALDRWILTAQPDRHLRGVIMRWIATLPDAPWQSPSQPFFPIDPHYDRRGARPPGAGAVAVIYTVEQATGRITIDEVDDHLVLPGD
jgi:hypothetical protein